MTDFTDFDPDLTIAEAVLRFGSHVISGETPVVADTKLSLDQVAGMIDHTLLKPEATEYQIKQLCQEARAYRFASVCVNPTWVSLCANLLAGSPVRVCTVVGFPLGATLTEVKVYEAEQAIQAGAGEVDMVINIGYLKSGRYAAVDKEMAGVVEAAHRQNAVAKVIFEMCLLTAEEKIAACVLAKHAGVDFVKTSTGFSSGGATAADVALMRKVVGPDLGIKAAGGIRTASDLRTMVAAGATRIGASVGVRIVQEFSQDGESSASSG